MHEFQFADAVLPRRFRILNLPLREYSLAHEIHLLRARNPLLCADWQSFNDLPAAHQQTAILRAVYICSCTHAELTAPDGDLAFVAWWLRNKIFSLWWNHKLFGLRCRWSGNDGGPWRLATTRRPNFELAIADFRNYLSEAHAGLPAPDPRADEIVAEAIGYEPMSKLRGRAHGAPYLAQLINFVSAHPELRTLNSEPRTLNPGLRTLNPELLDFPYARASLLYAAHLESEGSCRIENAAEHEEKLNWEKLIAEERAAELSTLNPEPSTIPTGLATQPPDLN